MRESLGLFPRSTTPSLTLLASVLLTPWNNVVRSHLRNPIPPDALAVAKQAWVKAFDKTQASQESTTSAVTEANSVISNEPISLPPATFNAIRLGKGAILGMLQDARSRGMEGLVLKGTQSCVF